MNGGMSGGLNRRRFLTVAAAAVAAPSWAGARTDTTRWRGAALGAEAVITLRGPEERAAAALAGARAALEEAERLFSLHDPASALSRLNAEGAARVPPRFADLLDLCRRLHRATRGRFDPTVQPLWRALATGGDPSRARALIGWDRVSHDGARIRLAPGQALTLNGVAQGVATDMVTEALAAEGFAETLVNIGEFRAGGGRWRVGVEDPSAGLVTTATLERTAIATSSPGATMVGGRPHILSPHPGRAPRWSTISVEAETAALADGLSTAFCLMDRPEIEAAALAAGGVRRVVMVDAEGDVATLRV